MNVNLHIERLILEGVEGMALNEKVLQTAVIEELTRLLAGGGLHPDLTGGGAKRSIRGEAFKLPAEGRADALGQHIAQAVYGGIGVRSNPSVSVGSRGRA
jgi:hypothetical protein